MSSAINTLRVMRKIQDSGLPEKQAEAIAAAIGAELDEGSWATKSDVAALKADMAALKSELKLHIYGMAAAVVAILKALEFAGL